MFAFIPVLLLDEKLKWKNGSFPTKKYIYTLYIRIVLMSLGFRVTAFTRKIIGLLDQTHVRLANRVLHVD